MIRRTPALRLPGPVVGPLGLRKHRSWTSVFVEKRVLGVVNYCVLLVKTLHVRSSETASDERVCREQLG
jgi:hypothetical protein